MASMEYGHFFRVADCLTATHQGQTNDFLRLLLRVRTNITRPFCVLKPLQRKKSSVKERSRRGGRGELERRRLQKPRNYGGLVRARDGGDPRRARRAGIDGMDGPLIGSERREHGRPGTVKIVMEWIGTVINGSDDIGQGAGNVGAKEIDIRVAPVLVLREGNVNRAGLAHLEGNLHGIGGGVRMALVDVAAIAQETTRAAQAMRIHGVTTVGARGDVRVIEDIDRGEDPRHYHLAAHHPLRLLERTARPRVDINPNTLLNMHWMT